MKRLLTIMALAIMALVAVPSASAYSPEMKEFAKLLNQEASKEGMTASYDGKNIIINFPSSFFDEDEKSALRSMGDLQPFKPIMLEAISQSMGADNLEMIGQLFELNDTNMVVRINLGTTTRDIVLTPSDLRGKKKTSTR